MTPAEYYAQAIAMDEYVGTMERNRQRFLENIEATELSVGDRLRFGKEPLHFLVITENWCNDSAQFVPPLVKLARELDNVEVRFLRRDEHPDFAAQYPRKDGYHAIPIILTLDAELQVIGVLVERPARVAAEFAAETRRFQQANPELPGINRMIDKMPEETRAAVKANNNNWRWDYQERFTRYLFDELAEKIESASPERAA